MRHGGANLFRVNVVQPGQLGAITRLVEPRRFGTAIGLMWVIQNAGIAGANLVAGWLNDRAGASAQNPAGYAPMMTFFIASSTIGFAFAVLLWLRTRGRTPAPASVPAAP